MSLPSSDPLKRIRDIIEHIDYARAFIAQAGGVDGVFGKAVMERFAMERALEIVSEAATKLRGQVDDLEPGIPWRDVRDFGNVLRHNYDGMNDAQIRSVIETDLQPLRDACERLEAHFSRD